MIHHDLLFLTDVKKKHAKSQNSKFAVIFFFVNKYMTHLDSNNIALYLDPRHIPMFTFSLICKRKAGFD